MKTRNTVLIVGCGVVLIVLLIWWNGRQRTIEMAHEPPVTTTSVPLLASNGAGVISIPEEYPRLSTKTMSRNEATRLYVARLRNDHAADWKMRIDFYGKVVDEDDRPVAGAKVELQWNTIGVPNGTLFAETTSDEGGKFSLEEKRGKILRVQVSKEGYYPVENGNGALNFEYADPSSAYYYEADSSHPVIFHMRSVGLHAANLLHWKREVALDKKGQKALDLKTGNTTTGGPSSFVIEVIDNSSAIGAFAWSAKISVPGGGLQVTTEQFPFLAPETGYEPSVVIGMATPKPPNWQDYQGAEIYIDTPDGFGRYEVRMQLGQHFVEVEGFFNPVAGSRDLEPLSK
jgi:Carboxypeptidase regulatory-like domain